MQIARLFPLPRRVVQYELASFPNNSRFQNCQSPAAWGFSLICPEPLEPLEELEFLEYNSNYQSYAQEANGYSRVAGSLAKDIQSCS
jgi:hypothetical protein